MNVLAKSKLEGRAGSSWQSGVVAIVGAAALFGVVIVDPPHLVDVYSPAFRK
jgi:hypothetical protein